MPDWVDKKRVPSSGKRIPFLSFFAGAGFLDLGFELESFEGIWHNEIDPWFVQAFEFGMSGALEKEKKVESDVSILDVGPNEILRKAFGERRTGRGRMGESTLFGIIGGPPCPDFSIGGKNKGERGDNGRLTQVYVDRICELQPTFFILENVKGLFKTAKHKEFLARAIAQLEGTGGFRVDVSVLNALDVGVAQDRQRVFVVGVMDAWLRKRGIRLKPGSRGWYPWPVDERYFGAKARYPWPTVDPFGRNPPMPAGIPVELTVSSAIGNPSEVAKLVNGDEGFVAYSGKFLEIDEGDTSRKSFKRLHRWRFSPTAAYGNNEVHLHPFLPRRLTVREAMRIQSAPDSYKLPAGMPLSKKFKTIGNAVPVRLARAVAASMSSYLEMANNG